jgi:hypothetical protein
MHPFAAVVTCLGLALFALLALLGDRQFANQERLPVRWGDPGRPKLYAPRRIGLAILPTTGTVLLLILGICRQPAFLLAAVVLAFAAGNLLYFRAVRRVLADA